MKRVTQTIAIGLFMAFLFSTHGNSQTIQKAESVKPFSIEFNAEKDGDWMGHYGPIEDENLGAIGVQGEEPPFYFTTAVKWEPSELTGLNDHQVTRVRFGVSDEPNSARIVIWQGADEGNLIECTFEDVNPQTGIDNEVDLTVPCVINASEELWFTIEWDDVGAGSFPALYENSTNTQGYGDLLMVGTPTTENSGWMTLNVVDGVDQGAWIKEIFVEGEFEGDYYDVLFIVTNEDDDAVAGATVSIDGKTGVTDSNGEVEIEDVREFDRAWTVSHPNYANASGSVTVVDGVVVEVTLSEDTNFIVDTETNELAVFPNPASEVINITNNNTINEVRVFDLTGRTIFGETVNDNQTVINVSEFNQGIYIIQIETDNGVESKRFNVVK